MLTFHMVIKLTIGFIFLLIIIRLLGKRNLPQLAPGDIVYFMVFGGILEGSIYDNNIKVWQVLIGLLTWALIIFITELLEAKSKKARKWLRGEACILINEGKVKHHYLKSNRLEIEQIIAVARENGIFDLSYIKNMYIESDGGFSIETYTYEYPIREENYPIYPIIENNKINDNNLTKISKNKNWLERELDKHYIKNISEVFYADWSKKRGLFILPYEYL